MNLPGGRTGKLLALALTAFLAFAVVQAVAVPLAGLYAERTANLEQLKATVARLEGGAAAIPALRRNVAALKAQAAWAQFALAGATDTLAAASLQSALSDLVAATGSRVASAEILPVQETEGWHRIGIRMAFEGELEQLATVLVDLDQARPVLFVDGMELASQGSERLKVSLDVFGYRAQEPAGPK